MKVALAQTNPTIGDFAGNAKRILDASARAASLGAEVAVFPELALTGYPPRDLVEQAEFVEHGLQALDDLARELRPRLSAWCHEMRAAAASRFGIPPH